MIISKEDFWFDRITKYVGTSKLIKLVANEDLHNIVDDIENPYEGNQEAIKEGKKHYVLKGCAALHCHGPKGKGSGGPALNKGVFNHSDGSTYSLAYIITNGIAGTKMGAYGSTLKEDEILVVLTSLQTYVSTGERSQKKYIAQYVFYFILSNTPSVQWIYVDLRFFNFQSIYVHFRMLCYE